MLSRWVHLYIFKRKRGKKRDVPLDSGLQCLVLNTWFSLQVTFLLTSETKVKFLPPGFGLAHSWPLQPFREWGCRCRLLLALSIFLSFPLPVSLSLCFPNKLILKEIILAVLFHHENTRSWRDRWVWFSQLQIPNFSRIPWPRGGRLQSMMSQYMIYFPTT